MRDLLVQLVALVAAGAMWSCSGGQQVAGDRPRMDLHCTPQPGFDEAVCAAGGEDCRYEPPLICRGVDVDDETRDEERRAFESGKQPCRCICKTDRERCAMTP